MNIMNQAALLRCIHPDCAATREVGDRDFVCPRCGGLLDVDYDWSRVRVPARLSELEQTGSRRNPLDFSGVWRFRCLLPFAPESHIPTLGEGQTLCLPADRVAPFVGMNPGCLWLQYEGLNPSGSFKDNGMSAAFAHARMTGARRAACASTGNTSASLALYAAACGMQSIIFIGAGKISLGKLSQALEYGALTLQIDGDFDDALRQVRTISQRLGIYLVNSINPFRLEGQKTIMYRVLEVLGWQAPEWIVVSGGNLGNTAAFGKALIELRRLGLLDRLPRLAVINAVGANTFYELHERRGLRWNGGRYDQQVVDRYYAELDTRQIRANTLASAIQILRPVNLPKALRAIEACGGCVREVTDQEILDAKAVVGRGGLGCEPASAAALAGLKKLRADGSIAPSDRVVCVLTGHLLKDPDATVAYHMADQRAFAEKLGEHGVRTAFWANKPVRVPNDAEAIMAAIEAHGA